MPFLHGSSVLPRPQLTTLDIDDFLDLKQLTPNLRLSVVIVFRAQRPTNKYTVMTSIVELFPKCRKLAYDARQQLAQVQNGVLPAQDLYISVDELMHQLDVMDQLVLRETPNQRQVWKRKILELREECISLKRQGQHYDRLVNANVRQEKERNELLRRRRKTPTNNESDLQNLAEEAQSLHQSHLLVDDLLNTGQASLAGLVDQRSRLRGVRRMVVDIGNRLGLTNTTMRIIERRDITDAYLVFAGMIITCIVIYFCHFHFEKK